MNTNKNLTFKEFTEKYELPYGDLVIDAFENSKENFMLRFRLEVIKAVYNLKDN